MESNRLVIPDPALVVLVGPSGSGKSAWANENYRPEEVVSSDRLRAVVGSGENDLDASEVAFSLLDQIVSARLSRGLNTVVDTLGFDDDRRIRHRLLARQHGLPAVAVTFATAAEVCRERNRARARPVPANVLTSQFRRFRSIDLGPEGWDLVVPAEVQVHISTRAAKSAPPMEASRGRFYLQISRFQEPIGPWLQETAVAAERVGFAGVAVMDHLIQVPQVGREWEPMPEAYTALAYLAALTQRVELGALVTNVRLRNPALLAKIIATLDALSGGRVFCGLGTGWFDQELRAYGYPLERNRFRQLEETIGILKAMWAPGKANFRGTDHEVADALSYPKPAHPVPIIVGGNGLRTRAIAVERAEGLNLIGMANAARIAPGMDIPGGFHLSVLDTPLIGGNRSEVAELVERHRGNRPAAAFARAHRAAIASDHVDAYREAIGWGVSAFFLAPVGLTEPADLGTWGEVIERVG